MADTLKEKAVLWALPVKDVFDHLKSSEKGLNDLEAKNRLEEFGPNEIAKKEKRHGFLIFLSQFKNALILVLVAAAIISYLLHENVEAAVIIAIVLMNAVLGFFQEYKAERALRELKKYVTLKSKVLRNGQVIEIDSKNLVPGDIVYLSIGDIIPADIRLLNAEKMLTDESSLTGESLPVLKKVTVVSEKHSLPQYLKNVAFMGTSVAGGSGHGIVISTGKNTFFGRTASYLKQKNVGDFQKNIGIFSSFMLKIILVMTVFIFIANALLGKDIFTSFLFAIALAVGITPEMLPIIMTITLSNGALKMAKENVITKRLVSVEDFGNIDTLCCDKTGTLTEGKISFADYINLDGKKENRLVVYSTLCNSELKGRKSFSNPIDKAIVESKFARQMQDELADYEILDSNEFDFERRRMRTLVKKGKETMLIAKGASDSLLKVCNSAIIKGKKAKLSKSISLSIHEKIISYEKKGYRVVGVAQKSTKKKKTEKSDEKEMTFLGLLLFTDPPKKTVKGALARLQELGVGIKIISGDSPVITRKICNDVGLTVSEDRVVTGEELEKLSDEQFASYSTRFNVFARVSPEQKYKIVHSLNKEGHIVGFLGDGINDVPALKAADVGISVNSAVSVAKEAADIILLKKSLRVLADGIVLGRKTFGNIIKYILNTISANYGNMVTVAMSSIFIPFLPLLPAQILLNNFVSDVPNFSISTDNVDKSLLKKPKRWNIKFISKFMVYFGLISTFFDLALILPLLFVVKASPDLFRTAWFFESVLSEIIILFAIRTKLSFFKSRPSKWLVITSIAAGIFALAITYMAFGRKFFNFVPMPAGILLFIAGILIAYFSVAEMAKRYFFRKFEI